VPSTRRSKILRNVGFNFIGAGVPLLVTLFTVPIYLAHVGAARYGVVLVAWSLLGYFGFMDFGISRATTNALARMTDLDASEAKVRVFWSSFVINGCLGVVGGAILYALGSFLFLHVMKIAPEVRGETLQSMPYIAAMLPLALMLGVGVGTAEAHEKFGILNAIQMTGLVLGQALPLLAVMRYGPSLTLIMPVMLGVRGATFVAITLYAMGSARIPLKPVIDLGIVRDLMSFGGWVTLTNIVSPIMTNIDQFVIGSVNAVATIPFYAVPLNIVNRTQIIPTTLTRTLFPIFSRSQKTDADALLNETLLHLSTIMTLVYTAGIFLSGPFLKVWLGHEMMERGAPVFQLLCIGAWANSLAFVLFSALQGQGRPRTVATIHTCEIIPYLAILWTLVELYGITGAAMAWTIRVTADCILLAWASKPWRSTLRALLPAVVCLLAAFGVARLTGPTLLPNLLATAAMCALFLAVNAVMNPSFKTMVRVIASPLRARMTTS
jgi:O-antigen/teichoic acid export membrane protein